MKLIQALSKDSYPYVGKIRKMSKSKEGLKVVFKSYPKIWFRVEGEKESYSTDIIWYIYPILPYWNGKDCYYEFWGLIEEFPEDYLRYQKYLQSFNVPGFKVKWTGAYPNLCRGEWIVAYNGKFLNLPEEEKSSHKGTYNQYPKWSLGGESGWKEIWDSYDSGVKFSDWIEEEKWWVAPWLRANNIPESEAERLYLAFQEKDWRHLSCGGCI